MKVLLAAFVMLCSSLGWSAEKSAPVPLATVVKGEVLEVKDVESYTYLRLKTADGEVWAAVAKAPLKKGEKVTIENVTVMTNFESKSLKKKFDKITFGNLAGAGSSMGAHGGAPSAVPKAEVVGDVKVAKASGPNARTVAEIVTKSAALKDKPVVVRGKVVKFTAAVMGKNWIHLRDGSGSAADRTDDVLVTTKDQAKIGGTVLVKGVVRTDKDFGSGYSYKVLIEDATLGQ
ncbi:MAG: nucleotide-binding protein [Sulfuritalea sp.]|jgi:hypothetical protein|nr:nucleotide-binding protein [Sulfuritalea sp.]